MGYYVVYAPDYTVIAISLFNNFAAAEELNKRALAWIQAATGAAVHRAGHRAGGAGDRAHAGATRRALLVISPSPGGGRGLAAPGRLGRTPLPIQQCPSG